MGLRKRRVVWLHIGMHRTASTSIQISLESLSKMGYSRGMIYYPSTGIEVRDGVFDYGHNSLVGHTLRSVDSDLFQRLRLEISTVPYDVPVLMSAEEFWSTDPQRIIAELGECETKVVCFDREFLDWLGSIWSLVSPTTLLGTPYEFFRRSIRDIGECRDRGDISFFDKNRIIERWVGAVGASNFYRIRYPVTNPLISLLEPILSGPIPADWRNLNVKENRSGDINEIINKILNRHGVAYNFPENNTEVAAFRALEIERMSGEKVFGDNVLKLLSIF